MKFPDWWLTASGMFFVLGSVFMIIGTAVACVLVWVLLELRVSINRLTSKVEEISDKVNEVAGTVKDVTTEVSTRASGLTRMVDDAAGGAMDVVERFAPLFIGLAAVFKLYRALFGRRG